MRTGVSLRRKEIIILATLGIMATFFYGFNETVAELNAQRAGMREQASNSAVALHVAPPRTADHAGLLASSASSNATEVVTLM